MAGSSTPKASQYPSIQVNQSRTTTAATSSNSPSLRTLSFRPTTQPTMRSFVSVTFFLAAAATATAELHPRYYNSASQDLSNQGSQSQNTVESTPYGISQSQSNSAYYNHQSSQVVQSFQPLVGLFNQIQGQISSGSISQYSASSYMNEIVSQLQPALNVINSCGCYDSPDVAPVVSSVFSQFSEIVQSFQSSFGASFSGIASPFQSVLPSLQAFMQQSLQSSSSSSYTQSIAPLVQTLQPVIPGFGSGFNK